MNYITTTELRTKSTNIIESLRKGEELNLVHRSKLIGAIVPKKGNFDKPIDSKRFANTLKSLEPRKKMTLKQMRKIYDHYMMYRHGPNIS